MNELTNEIFDLIYFQIFFPEFKTSSLFELPETLVYVPQNFTSVPQL